MSNIIPNRTARFFVIAVDVLLILLAYLGAFALASQFTLIEEKNIDAFVNIIPWILLIGICFFYVFELDQLSQNDNADLMRKLIVASLVILVLTIAASFLFREFALPRSVIFLAHFFLFLELFIWKKFFIKLTSVKFKDKALFIGEEEEFHLMRDSLLSSKLVTGSEVAWVKGDISLQELKTKIEPYHFVFIGSALNEKKKNNILYYAMKQKKSAYIIPNTNELFVMQTSFTTIGDSMVLQVKPFEMSNGQKLAKRMLDVFVAFLLLVITLPITLLTALAIKIEDKGPFFFKQERVGMDQKPFHILKFRSMIVDAEAKTGPVLAKSVDDRITKVGKFIRRTRIDELPQLLNVLKGDMSLVGPRPEREFFAKKYEKENKWFYYRSSVKPGITGYAQVLGFYTTSPERKLKFDLYYIRHYSIWLDIVLLFRTVLVVLNKTQSEGQTEKVAKEAKAILLKSGESVN